ncbi:bifunctional 4-hydroxy-2-oxoglutarate aldolase/2-dehydro-3-deoxy-phosphogluconate aldolase [Meridianimarinicoccus aquatilis]|uniref:2-dehydro-3-deoxy-phosphogluconate aldolase n=1 Tax=Meridianimarinicoccus aquatilis TaxID=2552766 RepID=A0A4R6B4F7_9RHOB|nr:bifunctional 4-hydroxy-2-oxoglutarate aldolase/2-dehydro-3-deoxy-phosphogluconate aldolase [Fluviibacterium aquatile]TDL91294.1 bifunctional 4-hydroxy-2-oxoglutarate aldolase/2-dehydro-3-deoxy-phosphogluconate aldolase [Fluviibacterium aquatile]
MTPETASERLLGVARKAPVIPVIVVDDAGKARDLAHALVTGGLYALEITLRTAQALDAIKAMSDVPGAVVGAGTLLTPDDARRAQDAGATFGVSPGSSDRLLDACEAMDLAMLPGAATATEAMALLERGYSFQKFFPAEAIGGVPALKGLSGPLPQITFCPTGGVSLANAPSYLSLPNTVCVGGSWVSPKALVDAGDWDGITKLAAEAAALTAS